MECLLSASVTGHLSLNNVTLSFALSESVSVDSFREEEAFLFACLLAGKLYTDLGYLRRDKNYALTGRDLCRRYIGELYPFPSEILRRWIVAFSWSKEDDTPKAYGAAYLNLACSIEYPALSFLKLEKDSLTIPSSIAVIESVWTEEIPSESSLLGPEATAISLKQVVGSILIAEEWRW
ncbi:hypothetical protein GOBAR_DD36644 [Gossypium barbadense]|nr:hypothetical protein GOBAR_DD36644 [Gossypium barbadense]